MLDYFYTLGIREGFESWAKYSGKGPRKKTHEYLVDVCWEREDVTLSVAIEVEVSDSSFDGIIHDLEKLIHIKAQLKVGVCYPNISEREKVLEKFGKMISNYKSRIPEEQYLLILLDHEKRKNKWLLKISGYAFEQNGRRHFIEGKLYPW